MTRESQKRSEQFYLDSFSQLRPDLFPTAPAPAEPPASDFLMSLPDRTIGIELTDFIWDAAGPSGSHARALHSLRRRAVEHTQKIWEAGRLPPVDVSLLWQERVRLSRHDIAPLAAALVDIVARNLPEIEDHMAIAHPGAGWKELPSRVAAIFISRPQWLRKSVWTFSQGGSVPHLQDSFGRIQQILDTKESLIPGYRQHSAEVWLLIVANMETIQSYVVIDDEPVSDHLLISSFDRAFLFSVAYGRSAELSFRRSDDPSGMKLGEFRLRTDWTPK